MKISHYEFKHEEMEGSMQRNNVMTEILMMKMDEIQAVT